MLKIVKANGTDEKNFIKDMKARAAEVDTKVEVVVSQIIDNVRKHGDKAIMQYTEQFDKCKLQSMLVTQEEIDVAYNQCDKALISAMENAKSNIYDFHTRQKQQSYWTSNDNGVMMGQKIRGLARVGIYVPGGLAAYPSSVLMNAIPAKVAEVGEIIMVTPPNAEGKINPNILTAAKIAGVDKIYKVGGAQAIAALAYGTESIPMVDKIVGPGNIFVATAKKMVFGQVDIDMIAGPSEILIIADESANPAYLAADLMSQAEHDPLASAILLTLSERMARDTSVEIEKQILNLQRSEIIKKSLNNYGVAIVCDTLDDAIKISEEIAPEHLELMVNQPFEMLTKINNAGSVFMGQYSPEPLGDYYAGPNHVLPTGGTSRFFSPLSVDSFIKKMSFINYTKEALSAVSGDISIFADAEGLSAHKNSVIIRNNA